MITCYSIVTAKGKVRALVKNSIPREHIGSATADTNACRCSLLFLVSPRASLEHQREAWHWQGKAGESSRSSQIPGCSYRTSNHQCKQKTTTFPQAKQPQCHQTRKVVSHRLLPYLTFAHHMYYSTTCTKHVHQPPEPRSPSSLKASVSTKTGTVAQDPTTNDISLLQQP